MKPGEKMRRGNVFYLEERQDFLTAGVEWLNSTAETEFGLIFGAVFLHFPRKKDYVTQQWYFHSIKGWGWAIPLSWKDFSCDLGATIRIK